MNEKKIVVSICCIAYNQEKYIRDTLEGFIFQKVTFPMEIIINDDCSTDNTAKIIREYAEKYPELIKPIFQTENQYSKGKKMFPITFARAKGTYIACCEGDDYWTDPNKLQRQVDFLNSHQDYVMVTENAIVDILKTGTKRKFSKLPERDIDLLELLGERTFATASVFFRNLGEQIMPKGDGTTIDTIMWCHLSKFGKIRYLENVSSVYRRHSEGLTGGEVVQWSKDVVGWNKTLRQNHPEIDPLVFKERIIGQFKVVVRELMGKKRYKKTLLSIDELADSTEDPLEYKLELYNYLEELLQQKDNSMSLKIGRIITKPLNKILEINHRISTSAWKLLRHIKI